MTTFKFDDVANLMHFALKNDIFSIIETTKLSWVATAKICCSSSGQNTPGYFPDKCFHLLGDGAISSKSFTKSHFGLPAYPHPDVWAVASTA